MANVSFGNSERQVDEQPAVERQAVDGFVLHHVTEADVLRFQHLGGSDDRHRLALLTYRKGQVEAHGLTYLERDVPRERREPGSFNGERISAGHETRKL